MASNQTPAQKKIVSYADARYGVAYRSMFGAYTEFYAKKEHAEARLKEITGECLLMKVEKAVAYQKKVTEY